MKDQTQLRDHTFSVLVYNEPGVLAKVSGLITRRGFNIESFSAGDAKEKGMCRLTIIVKGDDRGIEQIQKQIYKIIDTVKVSPIEEEDKIEMEMALMKIKARNGEKMEILQLVSVHKAGVVDTSPDGFVVAMMGERREVDRFIRTFPPNNVLEIARTGVVAMNRWN